MLTLLKLSIPLPDTLMIYKILITFTLNKWLTEKNLLNFNYIKLFFSDIEASFLYLNLSISNSTVSAKIYDKWDNFAILI